jgi:SAM-dependent methyltransferase
LRTPPRSVLDPDIAAVHADIDRYYTAKISRHGATPLGVDWSCQPTQQLRFLQLLHLSGNATRFSLNDLGCGYGALLEYLDEYHPSCEVDYLGIDLSAAMIRRARRKWRGRSGACFAIGHTSPRVADFCLASGIFNVKLDQPLKHWERFVSETLSAMANSVRRGFAANFMAPSAPSQPGSPQLYRCPAGRWAGYCERELDMAVEIVSGYGLSEYTLLARRQLS